MPRSKPLHPALNAKTVRSVLKALSEFKRDYVEVRFEGQGVNVTVRFAESAAEPAKAKKPDPAKSPATVSAIRSLSMTPPVFEGPLEGEKA